MRSHSCYAKVRILPEYTLPDPINLCLSNNLKRFTQNPSQANGIKRLLANSSRWPKFVYDQYSIVCVNEKIERYMAMLNLEAPDDPVLKSFWLARNIPLNQSDRLKIFTSNCVNKRMLLIGNSLNFVSKPCIKPFQILSKLMTSRCAISIVNDVRNTSHPIPIYLQWLKEM